MKSTVAWRGALCLADPKPVGRDASSRRQADPAKVAKSFVATTGLGEDADVLHTCLAGFAGHRVNPIMPEMVGTLLDKVLPARPPRDSSV